MKRLILVLWAMFLMLSLAVMTASFSGEKGAKADSKTPAKCWQKLPPLDERLISPNYNTVCKAYEEVLNTTCEPPEKVQCNWTLPEGEKRFKKLEWKPLEPKEYWGLIQDIALSGWNEKFRVGQWDKFEEPEYKKELEQGTLRLSLTTVDINQDGKEEQVAGLKRGVCNNIGWQYVYGVMNPETKRIDWKRNKVFFHVNGSGSEIMLYEGRAFIFQIENLYEPETGFPTKEVMLDKECRFKYLKGGTKQ